MYNFIEHTVLCFSFSSLSLDTNSTRCSVSAKPAIASLRALHICLDSGVDNSQLCILCIVKAYLGRSSVQDLSVASPIQHILYCMSAIGPANQVIHIYSYGEQICQ